MIREAEQNGNAFVAIWHLDRLIAARPDDGFLFHAAAPRVVPVRPVRQGRRRLPAGQAAGQAGGCSGLSDSLRRRLHKGRTLGRGPLVPRPPIAARPDDGMLHEDRAAVYGKLGREADRQAECAHVFELGADEGLVIPRAEELGRAGRWSEARPAGAPRPDRAAQPRVVRAWAIACLKAGGRAGYPEACAAFLTCQGPNPTVVSNELERGVALRPGGRGAERLSGAGGMVREPPFRRSRASTVVPALVLERAGRTTFAGRPNG